MALLPRLSLLLGIVLLVACAPPAPVVPPADIPGATGIAGAVRDPVGQPAVGAMVYAYRSAKSGLRGPADFAAEVGADGRFFLDLVEGRYYLVARRRQGSGDAGPPRPGDAWSIYPRNPVTVNAERTTRVDFQLQGVTQPNLLKEGSLSGGDTGFTGRLLDAHGTPIAGAFVLGYRDSDFRRMPDFTSAASAVDGRFTLFVPTAGRYCLAARIRTRGQPGAGELYGQLGSAEAACRTATTGTLLDVGVIRLEPFHPH